MLAYQAFVVSVALFAAQFFRCGREFRPAEAGNIAGLLPAPMSSIIPDALSSLCTFARRRCFALIDVQARAMLFRMALRLE